MNKISRSNNVFQVDTFLMDRMTLFVESDNGGPIYIVPRNLASQIYIARHLACRHTIKKLQFTQEYLPTLPPAREVRYYDPTKDHEDDFFVVINTTSAFTHQFPFEALREYTVTTTSEDSTQEVQRQSSKVNRGFTSLMSMGERALNGVPVPKLKQGTDDGIIQLAHLRVSYILLQVFFPWIGGPIQPDPERVRLAEGISPGNILEASTFTIVEERPWHRDTLNPAPPDDHSTFVMNINHKFADMGTLTTLFYQRSSVCSHLRNSGVQDPLLEFLYESYINFAEDRRTFPYWPARLLLWTPPVPTPEATLNVTKLGVILKMNV
jgi:hypothetical protein